MSRNSKASKPAGKMGIMMMIGTDEEKKHKTAAGDFKKREASLSL